MSIKNFAYCLTVTLAFISVHNAFGQQPALPREKVHLHTDKPFYSAGDTLWFKAYTVQAGSNEPSAISKILYAELLGLNGKSITQLKLPLQTGLAHGDMILPDTLKEGRYRLRAYTQWMRNLGNEAFFEKDIALVSGFPTKTAGNAHQPAAGATPVVQFFPEGGEWVAGLRSRVGVKVTGINGLGLYAEGEVLEENNEVTARFATTYAGMGSFVFTPQAGKRYTAQIRLQNGTLLKQPLPAGKDQGYVLTVNNNEADTVFMSINQSKGLPPNELLLTAGNQANEYYSARLLSRGSRSAVAIPREQLPDGVLRITLYTKDKQPLAERLLFNQRREALSLRLSMASKNGSAADSTAVTLLAFDEQNKPLQGSFSMAVVKAGDVPYQEDDDLGIRADLLLTSELKGHIEHPNYYFTAKNKADSTERAKQLDNLLLTQGWRRFVKSTITAAYPPETGLTITGKLLNNKNQPLANSKVRLFATAEALPLLIDTLTDAQGHFEFNDLEFYGTFNYLIQTPEVKNQNNVKVLIDTIAPAAPPVFNLPGTDTLTALRQLASTSRFGKMAQNGVVRRGIVLNEVAVKAKKPVYSSSGGMRKQADRVLGPDRFKNVGSIKEVIEWSGSLIKWNNEGNAIYQGKRKVEAAQGFSVMIDGHLYTDNDLLRTMDPHEVESVEIFLNGAIVGVFGKGVIVVNTKSKDPYRNLAAEKVAGVSTFAGTGYTPARQFYSPRYYPGQDSKPDLRDVVYWNPYVAPNELGKAVLTFYQSRVTESFRVTVEGMTADGRLGRVVYQYGGANP